MTDTMPYRTWVEMRSCRGKRVFTCPDRAARNAERAADLYGDPRSAWGAYPCEVRRRRLRRRHWHIGHKAGGDRG